MEKNDNFWDLCNKRPPRGHLLDRGRLIERGVQPKILFRGRRLLDTGRLLEAGRLLDHLRYVRIFGELKSFWSRKFCSSLV